MYLAILAAHVILAVLLILTILVQPGKGGDVGAAFGGGDSGLFGPQGPASALSRITSAVAVLFMCTSITLAYFSNKEILSNSNVLDEIERVNQERLDKAAADAVPAPADAEVAEPPQVIEMVPVEPSGEGAPSEADGAAPPAPAEPPSEGAPVTP